MAKRVLALDFDGVICDSAPECFWVALRTLALIQPHGPWEKRLAEFRGEGEAHEGPANREILVGNALYRGFVRLMPLGNRAEDFAIALLALEEGVSLRDQSAYDSYYNDQAVGLADEFHDRFYRERTALRRRSPHRWGELMRSYPGLAEILLRRAGSVQQVIATAKDRASVRFLLAQFGLDQLFPEDRVFDKEYGRDKAAHLRAIQERFGGPDAEFMFVDDKVNHLTAVESLGVRGVLAAWGYNGRAEHELAAARGYPVCRLPDVESVLFP